MQFEQFHTSERTSLTNEHAHSINEKHPEHCDIADPKTQTALIVRFFEKQYPDMPLDDPDTRNLAARQWVGGDNPESSMSAKFRKYIDSSVGDARVVDIKNKQLLDDILNALA